MSKQGEIARAKHLEQEERHAAMSDKELRGTVLTMVYILFGQRALDILGFKFKP